MDRHSYGTDRWKLICGGMACARARQTGTDLTPLNGADLRERLDYQA